MPTVVAELVAAVDYNRIDRPPPLSSPAEGDQVAARLRAVLIPTERKSAKDFDLRDSLHTCEQTSRHTRALASGYPVVVLPRGRLLGTKECHESVVRML